MTQGASELKRRVGRRLRALIPGAGNGQENMGYRELFQNRDYRLLFSGLAISMSGSWAYSVALVVFVFNATHSPAWVAAASMTRFVSALVISPVGGLVADRLERVRLMVTLDTVAAVLQSALAVVAVLDGPVLLAIVLATLTAVTTSSYDPAARAATPAIVGEDHLAAANSAQSAVENLSMIVGPAIAGVLLLAGPPAVVFAVNAATFAFSAVVIGRMRSRNHPSDITEGGAAGPLKQMTAGIIAFVESPTAMLLAGFSILATFVYGTDTVLFVVISKQQLGTGSNGYGYLLAAYGVGGILIAGYMNRLAAARRLGPVIVAGMAVYCLPTAVLSIVHSPWIAFLLEVVRGAGTVVVDVLAITALQRLVSSRRRCPGVRRVLCPPARRCLIGRSAHANPARERRVDRHAPDHGIGDPDPQCGRLSVDPPPRHARDPRAVGDRAPDRNTARARHPRRGHQGCPGTAGAIGG